MVEWAKHHIAHISAAGGLGGGALVWAFFKDTIKAFLTEWWSEHKLDRAAKRDAMRMPQISPNETMKQLIDLLREDLKQNREMLAAVLVSSQSTATDTRELTTQSKWLHDRIIEIRGAVMAHGG